MGGLFGGSGGTISNVEPVAAGLRIQTSAYGMALPVVYGRQRIPGNLMWYGDFTPIAHTTTTGSGGGGGKGGGGGVSSSQTSWTYNASFMLGLCEGPVTAINAYWGDKEFHADASATFTLKLGDYPQSAWSYLSSSHLDQAVTYQGVAYAAAASYNLGDSTYLPNHTFDVTGRLPFSAGTIDDSNPSDIVVDVLTNSHYGVGFPLEKIGSLTQFSNYCVASGIFLSPAYSDQQQASELLTRLMRISNTAVFYSEGVLKFAPYGDTQVTGNGATYTPLAAAVYDLTDDDYLDQDMPIRVTRNSSADAYNQTQVEFLNRENQYNTEIADAKDLVAIDTFGLLPMEPVQAHEIADPAVARTIAQILLQRSLFIRNQYEFTLGWKYCLLEPTDLLTLTDSALGFDKLPVRILSIEENGENGYDIIAEDYPAGVSSASMYPSSSGAGYAQNYNATPGNANAPIIFEAPSVLTTTGGLEVWIGASGSAQWGGAQVWASQDGSSYSMAGVITNPVRQGVLTTDLASGQDPDQSNTLSVSTAMSRSQLTSGTQADADGFNTLCYVDGELIAYRDATLTGPNAYSLNYLRRGVYNSTVSAHVAGTQFSRIDSAAFLKLPFTPDRIGSMMYVKLVSHNIFGSGQQQIADIDPICFKITGSALTAPLPNVLNPAMNYVAGQTQIYWDDISDFRQPAVDYEVRFGASWASGTVVGRTAIPQFAAVGDGDYWIAARYYVDGSGNVYSATPTHVVVAGSSLVKNVIASFDQVSTGWIGDCDPGVAVVGSEIQLAGAGNIIAEPDVLSLTNFTLYGGVSAQGIYTLPAGHTVALTKPAACTVTMSFAARGENIDSDFLSSADILANQDILESAMGASILVRPQISTAQSDGVFSAWQDFVPGVYNAQYFKSRVIIQTASNAVIGYLSGFVFSVDVPDRIDNGQITTAPAGSTVAYSAPFNGGPSGLNEPAPQITIVNASAGDDLVLSSISKSGFSVRVVNGGVGVVRTINWLSQGY